MTFSLELKTAIRAAKAAGLEQAKAFTQIQNKNLKTRQKRTAKTGRLCEQKIKKILQTEFPNYFISSRRKKPNSKARPVWIIEGLNASDMYSRSMPVSSVLIALQRGQELELGVIYQPFQKILLAAERNKGTYCNGKRTHVSGQQLVQKSHLSYNGINYPLQNHTNGLKKLFNVVQSRSSLSWIETIIHTACGNADISIGGKGNYWEFAAPKIIIEEADGTFSSYTGKTGLAEIQAPVAANPILHEKIMKILKK